MWFASLFGRPAPARARRARCPLSVEPLESRAVMSAVVVVTEEPPPYPGYNPSDPVMGPVFVTPDPESV